ncbi:SGNH/GDSL hydrolase family protein [Corynebacterium variabile]|uniref:SGNH/GDSL hydrolase family protein n=1 Tax=Corynebacterium variabile TaxID=1727 RepID=UPI002FE0E2FE
MNTSTRRMRANRAITAALIVAGASVGTTGVAQANDRWSTPNVAGLGDSFGSGEGTHVYYPAVYGTPGRPLECHRSQYSWQAEMLTYTGKVSSSLPGFVNNKFVACSGATTKDILANQLGAINASTDVIYLSMGGNDAHFSDVLNHCAISKAMPGDTCLTKASSLFGITNPEYRDKPIETSLKPFIENNVKANLRVAIEAIHATAPNAKIVWAGYPDLLGSPTSLFPNCLQREVNLYNLGGTRFRMWVSERTRDMNAVIKSVASEQVKGLFTDEGVGGV